MLILVNSVQFLHNNTSINTIWQTWIFTNVFFFFIIIMFTADKVTEVIITDCTF